MTMIKKAAAVAAASTMALGAVAPMVASAQTVAAVPVSSYYFFGGNGGSGVNSNNLASLFVLGSLFSGPYGNGVIGNGTSLGGLLMLNQIFNNSGNSGWNW